MEKENKGEQASIDPFARQHLLFTNPASWYEAVYTSAGGDATKVPWAKRTITPVLAAWLDHHHPGSPDAHALVIGCGLGDDAEALIHLDLQVTAFDISSRAIAWCRERFPRSLVNYQVADLLHPSASWQHAFTFVWENLTI